MWSTRFLKILEEAILQHLADLFEQEEQQALSLSSKEVTIDNAKRNNGHGSKILAAVVLIVFVHLDLAAGNVLASPSSIAMGLGGGAARSF